jgi:predicted  nucleic acid-binding Zn-ribbon protein
LSYFTTAGLVTERTDSSIREAITAWYNAEKEAINEKESRLDIRIQDLTTEFEAAKTEIQSIEAMLEDDLKSFEFAKG